MKIYVDADACPKVIKSILFKAANRLKISVVMVANRYLQPPISKYVTSLQVDKGLDEADDKIVEMLDVGDLVITADIPLASRVIEKGGYALNPRGELYTEENVRQQLSMRNFMTELRESGVETGGPSSFNQKDRQAFANQLDRFLQKHGNS